jgi:hypothetical protein
MKAVVSLTVRVRAAISFAICACCWLSPSAHAQTQTNSWTNSSSGNWEEPYWSLGVLPGTNQTVLFTNSGVKVLTIGPNTSQNFPDTMSVNSVTVSSPQDSANILLFSDAGSQTWFIANTFTIGSNAVALLYSSSLQVKSYPTEIDGIFIQDGASQASNDWLEVNGTYQLNNGILTTSGTETLWGGSARFVQSGGSNYSSVDIFTNSEFQMIGGELNGQITLLDGGIFNQAGGHVSSPAGFRIDGNFIQTGGIFEGPTSQPTELPTRVYPGDTIFAASILQTGGTNTESSLVLGYPWLGPDGPSDGSGCGEIPPGSGRYTLSNAALNDGGVIMGPGGSFTQSSGTHTINGDLSAQGLLAIFYEHHTTNWRIDCEIDVGYWLYGGVLSVQNIHLGPESFVYQGDGTNQVSGAITLTNAADAVAGTAYYGIGGGLLLVPKIVSQNGKFTQFGGTILVGDVQMLGQAWFNQSGGSIVQTGRLTLNGTWQSGPGNQQLGQLLPGTASLLMPNAGCLLRFSESGSLAWPTNSLLHLTNWSGSLYGGGQQQIIFGSNSAALTPQQLNQIQFQNPAGLAPGNYPARILATGEIVPDTGAPLPPRLDISCASANGTMQLTLGGDIGRSYDIEVSTDLVNWMWWTNELNSNGTISVGDWEATNFPQRFYRARVSP